MNKKIEYKSEAAELPQSTRLKCGHIWSNRTANPREGPRALPLYQTERTQHFQKTLTIETGMTTGSRMYVTYKN